MRILATALLAVVLALYALPASAQEPTGDPPPLPEPWESLIPFACGNVSDIIGYSEIRNGVSECYEGVLQSCIEDGLIGNSDCRGIAQVTTLYALNSEPGGYEESYSSYAWRRYDFGVCMIEAYAAANAGELNEFPGGVGVPDEAVFLAAHAHYCDGSPILFSVSSANAEDRTQWQHDADWPIDGTEAGDPNKCAVYRIVGHCGAFGDTNPNNAGVICADGKDAKAVPLDGEDWTCLTSEVSEAPVTVVVDGVEVPVEALRPPAAGFGVLPSGTPWQVPAALALLALGMGTLTLAQMVRR